MVRNLDDTIAAIATPLGEGGVGVVRISGDQVIRIAGTIIKDFPQDIEPRKVYHSWVIHQGKSAFVKTSADKPIDEVLYYWLKAPQSYTGEDTVEISCHGGIAVLRSVLGAVLQAGARLAEKGEFTKRAFLNGRIDLMQAEAVLDLVKAKTEEGVEIAVDQLKGSLSQKVKELRSALVSIQAGLEATIDFPEDVPEINPQELSNDLLKITTEIEHLLTTADLGKIMREGLATVIVGKPNVGKSSLLNHLLKEDRAIVTEIPGTTRDTIEETINLEGLPLRIVDTAGLRHPRDQAEEFGVSRARKELAKSDLALLVLDASTELDSNDRMILNEAKGRKAIVVLNKIDLGQKLNENDLYPHLNGSPIFKTSALKGAGITELERGILDYIGLKRIEGGNESFMINTRHRDCLLRAKQSLTEALKSAKKDMALDFIAIDLKGAIVALGEATGEAVSEEVINRIFEEFCVGK